MSAAAPALVFAQETARARWTMPVLVLVGLLIAIVTSLGPPLVPTIAVDYGVAPGTAQWSFTITLLIGAVLTPVIGRLGDGRHRRTVLLASMIALIAGCILAALPLDVFAVLVAGRGLQGVGLTLLPLTMSIARDHLEPAQSRSTIATLSVTAIVGVGLGYPLTGLVAEFTDFRIAFWAAAGMGTVALVAAMIVVPASSHHERRRFDLTGTILLGAALAVLIYSLGEGGSWGWGSPSTLSLIAAAPVLLAIWVALSLRREQPLVDLRILRHRPVFTVSIASLMSGVCLYLLMSTVILYVETPVAAAGLGATTLVRRSGAPADVDHQLQHDHDRGEARPTVPGVAHASHRHPRHRGQPRGVRHRERFDLARHGDPRARDRMLVRGHAAHHHRHGPAGRDQQRARAQSGWRMPGPISSTFTDERPPVASDDGPERPLDSRRAD